MFGGFNLVLFEQKKHPFVACLLTKSDSSISQVVSKCVEWCQCDQQTGHCIEACKSAPRSGGCVVDQGPVASDFITSTLSLSFQSY